MVRGCEGNNFDLMIFSFVNSKRNETGSLSSAIPSEDIEKLNIVHVSVYFMHVITHEFQFF